MPLNLITTIIGSVIVFSLVIFLHELGHFTVAKLCGVKVNEFSIGMGPKLFQRQRGETKYSLRALPVGGYVAMEGEEENSEDPRSFNNVSVLKRIAIVLAGVFMNFVLAIICFSILFFYIGFGTNIIDRVMENSPAMEAGLKKNDRILKVNNIETKDLLSISREIEKSGDEPLSLEIFRDGKSGQKTLKAEYSKEENRFLLGFTAVRERNLFKAIGEGFKTTKGVVKAIFSIFDIIKEGKFSGDMISGPIGVISIIGQETSKGIIYLIQIIGIISANLAVMNLLPIPGLDGGKFVLLIIEGIRGKAISQKVEANLTMIGYVFLLCLMIYVTIFNDLGRLFKWQLIEEKQDKLELEMF